MRSAGCQFPISMIKRSLFLPFKWWGSLRYCGVALCGLLLFWSGIAQADPLSAASSPDLYREAMLAISEGRLGEAEKFLAELVAEEPRHAGAWLDLAILYCASGNTDAAEHLFSEIERRFAPPPPILEVIAHQRKLGCAGWLPKTNATIRAGRGYESNVNQGARSPNFSIGGGGSQIDLVLLPAFRPRGDQFTNVSGELVRNLSENGAFGVVQFQSRTYDKLSHYDTIALFVGGENPWRWDRWIGRLSGTTGFMTLDGEVYLKQTQIQFEVVPPLPLGRGWQFGVTGSWSHIAYPTLSNFDAQWWEARGGLSHQGEDSWWQANVGTVTDKQSDERPGGNRTGIFANIRGRFALGSRVQGEIGWQFQRWEGDKAYFPGLIDLQRIQNTSLIRTAATFSLNDCHAMNLEFKDIRNDENISIFEYRNWILQLNWQWQPLRKC